jgi:hypothetical protein
MVCVRSREILEVFKGYTKFRNHLKISPLQSFSLKDRIPRGVWGYAEFYNLVKGYAKE